MKTRAVEIKGNEPIVTEITQTLHIENNAEYRNLYARARDADHWFDSVLYREQQRPAGYPHLRTGAGRCIDRPAIETLCWPRWCTAAWTRTQTPTSRCWCG